VTPCSSFVNGSAENVVERTYLFLHATAVLCIDEGVLCCREDVPCDDDMGSAEVNHAVAVGHRVRLVKKFPTGSSCETLAAGPRDRCRRDRVFCRFGRLHPDFVVGY
jgi:hypothetical protein